MTILAIIFMLVSVSLVTGLAIFCYYRVLSNGKAGANHGNKIADKD